MTVHNIRTDRNLLGLRPIFIIFVEVVPMDHLLVTTSCHFQGRDIVLEGGLLCDKLLPVIRDHEFTNLALFVKIS